jgi:hypothetical protein
MKDILIMLYEFLGGSLLFTAHHYFNDLFSPIIKISFALFVAFTVSIYIYLDIKLTWQINVKNVGITKNIIKILIC